MKKLFILLFICITSFCFAQTPIDSAKIKKTERLRKQASFEVVSLSFEFNYQFLFLYVKIKNNTQLYNVNKEVNLSGLEGTLIIKDSLNNEITKLKLDATNTQPWQIAYNNTDTIRFKLFYDGIHTSKEASSLFVETNKKLSKISFNSLKFDWIPDRFSYR